MSDNALIDYGSIVSEFDQNGLNLSALLDPGVADLMPDLTPSAGNRHILLLGSTGQRLWQQIPADYFERQDPVDEFTLHSIERVLGRYLETGDWQVLYPGLSPDGSYIPLQQLGVLAGWHHPSPLGIGINARHGLWFAYRAVVVISADFAPTTPCDPLPANSPCLECDAAPCLSACPADALAIDANPALTACVSHRLQPESGCASTCVARLACPVGVSFQYSTAQIAYHYDKSLLSARKWVKHKRSPSD